MCLEAAAKTQTSVKKRSDVVESDEFEASGSDESNATDIEEYGEFKEKNSSKYISFVDRISFYFCFTLEGINKAPAAETNKTDELEITASDIAEASETNQAVKDESGKCMKSSNNKFMYCVVILNLEGYTLHFKNHTICASISLHNWKLVLIFFFFVCVLLG